MGVLADAFGAHVFQRWDILRYYLNFLIQSVMDGTDIHRVLELTHTVLKRILSHQYLDLALISSSRCVKPLLPFSNWIKNRVEWALLAFRSTALVGLLFYLELYFFLFFCSVFTIIYFLLNFLGFGNSNTLSFFTNWTDMNILMERVIRYCFLSV